jgi:hypothetical protein
VKPGPPLSKPAGERKAGRAFEELWESLENADRLGIIFSLPAIGLTAVLVKLIEPGSPEEGLRSFWEVFVGTAPLSCSVALILIACLRKWYSAKGLLTFSVLALFVATWLGAHYGNPALRQNVDTYLQFLKLGPIGIAAGYILLTLQQYWRLYGDWKFLCSAASGAYVGWVWGAKILPHFD